MPTATTSNHLHAMSTDEVIASYIDAELAMALADESSSETERELSYPGPASGRDAGAEGAAARDANDAITDEILSRIDETLDLIAEANRSCDRTLPIDRVDVSVIIPVHNCRETLPDVLDRIDEVMPPATETIIVDDASDDGSWHYAKSRAARSRMTVIGRRCHHGRGSAIRLGVRHSVGHVVAIQDADLAYDPADLLGAIWPILEDRADAVYCSRHLRRNTPRQPGVLGWLDRCGNWSSTTLSNRLTGLHLSDLGNPQKVFRGELIRRCRLTESGSGFDAEVTAKIAARKSVVIEVPTHFDPEAVERHHRAASGKIWESLRAAWQHRNR